MREAMRLGLIAPILVGPRARIEAVAKTFNVDIAGIAIVDAPYSNAAADAAVQLVREGRAEALTKGSLHTDELMAAMVKRDVGLRTARRISHCFVMDVPNHAEALIITGAAVSIAPMPEDKVDICGTPSTWRTPWGSGSAGRDPLGNGDRQSEGAVHH